MAERITKFDEEEEIRKLGDDSTKIKTLAFKINGNITDIVLCDYSDKQFLMITQFEKVGTLILLTKNSVKNLSGVNDMYDAKTLCGMDSEEYHLATRYLAQQLQIDKPILFGICLKDYSLNSLQNIVQVLKESCFF